MNHHASTGWRPLQPQTGPSRTLVRTSAAGPALSEMMNWRLAAVVSVSLAPLVACTAPHHHEGELSSAVMTSEVQARMAPMDALADLKAGNARFMAGHLTPRDYLSQADTTAEGQYPKAVVLSCLDSRVPPEVIFDQGIGDIFVGRIAGNFENVDMLGSLEFATAAAGTPLIVILGHSSCGAIKGAADGVELGNLTAMLDNLDPALAAARGRTSGDQSSKNPALIAAAVEANVAQTMADILERSDVIAGLVASGDVAIVGGVYDLGSGRVDWLEQ
ncbi:carbonic anhydrase family protein [Engelhardtia mirabilis]|uniref:Carbonic anhydrase n=1 Tax=Engelhardtia mirabilis TaxID=2528011 RepID=A0A518BJE6_9BACT|nr:Carbonic anhydrase [Planctomycetes bacterium Pla133]QDV01415.1 Carbonic anhydrase [Planctomycetes bacterium Pla86]